MEEIIINEEWRSISGHLSYQVSNIGRVRNVKSGRILKPYTSSSGYESLNLYINGKRSHHDIHRLVALEFISNPMHKPEVDHIDSKAKSNNNIWNLRWATFQEQEANKPKRLNLSSKYKGVHWSKDMSKWRAQIQVDKKIFSLGCFKSEEEAGLAYNEQAILHFGDFAQLNVIDLQRWSSSSYSLRNVNDTQDVQDSSKTLKILILIIIITLLHKHYINL